MEKSKNWTKEELDILCKHYPYMGAYHLLSLLPGRTIDSIYKKARYLGIAAYRRKETFITYLHENLGKKTYQQMSAEVGCSEANIRYRVRTLCSLI